MTNFCKLGVVPILEVNFVGASTQIGICNQHIVRAIWDRCADKLHFAFDTFLYLPRNFLLHLGCDVVKVVDENDISGSTQLFDE